MAIWKGMQIEFIPRSEQHSEYDWTDLSKDSQRVGKVRCRIEAHSITIFSINIYPEWAGHGFGRKFVEYCKEHFQKIIADRVRHSAIGFWEAMGFSDHHDSTWIYENPHP